MLLLLHVSLTSCSKQNEYCAMSGMSFHLVRKRGQVMEDKRRDTATEQLICLQQQTLAAVSSLVDIQRQMLEVKKAKLEVEREKVVMIGKAQLALKGWFQNKDGNSVALATQVRTIAGLCSYLSFCYFVCLQHLMICTLSFSRFLDLCWMNPTEAINVTILHV